MDCLKIVIYSPAFHPLLGGVETVVQVLAAEWSALGEEVTVITDTMNSEPDSFPFRVLRRGSWWQVWQTVRQSDVFVHVNVSLWGFLPWLFCGWKRPAWVATHHGWYYDPMKPAPFLARLKMILLRFATANVSVSAAVNCFLGNPGVVIPNPYDDLTFRRMPEVSRMHDLVFLGRLVSEKGGGLLLDAMAILQRQGIRPELTVIGSGPELQALCAQAMALGLAGRVTFVGPKHGRELATLLNAHRVMVVPSRCNEGFGVVALEGIACGCIVVGSSGGGLPEAIGPCGITFPNGDAQALAFQLEAVLSNDALCQELASHAPAHLARHQKKQIAALYHELLQKVVV